MQTIRVQNQMAVMIDQMGTVNAAVISIFVFAMSLILWNAGLIGSLRRYGEIGLRLAIGERHGHVVRTMIAESLMIGALGAIAGTAAGKTVFTGAATTAGLASGPGAGTGPAGGCAAT